MSGSGTSSQQQQQNQQTTQNQVSNPWAPAVPFLQGLLGAITPLTGAAGGLTPEQQSAFQSLQSNAQSGNPYATPIAGYASNLLSGGGAQNQAGRISGAFDTLNQQLSPIANSTPGQISPQLQSVLDTLGTDITNRTNAYYAGAGRDLSGANAFNLTRGLAAGEAPALLGQYNQDLQNKITGANTLFQANQGTGGILSALGQASLANQGQGVDAATAALQARDSAANQQLQIASQMYGIPVQQLAQLAQIGIPIAGLGGQVQGAGTQTGTISGTSTLSPVAQAQGWANVFGNASKAFFPVPGG